MDRVIQTYSGATLIETTTFDVNWTEVRLERDEMLRRADIWMLVDRYTTLTDSQKTELTNYRQALRVLPQTYYDEDDFNEETGLGSKGANDAADNFPTPPDWMN